MQQLITFGDTKLEGDNKLSDFKLSERCGTWIHSFNDYQSKTKKKCIVSYLN